MAEVKGQFNYQDFDLLIEPGEPGSYRARVVRSPTGESGPARFTLPFSQLELENFLLKVAGGGRRKRGPGRPENAPLKEFGGKLYGAVFQDELRELLQGSLTLTRVQQMGMRLRLRLADVPELAELPWEFLYDPRHNRFLAQSRRTPLVRYLDLPDPPLPLGVEGPLRLLVMISSPSDYPALNGEEEWDLLTGALARQQAEGRIIIERLAANMTMLRQRLRQEEFHVVHFIGHGRYRADWGSGVLVMEDRTGRPQEVTGEEFGGLLNEYDQTRLAVLNACEGARSDASDSFAGVAQSLIQQGLTAVVAMQFEITDDAAVIFAREFYGAMADGYPLEVALAEARGAIRDEGNFIEWGTPVLYSRASDGRLFDLTGPTTQRVVPLRQAAIHLTAAGPAQRSRPSSDTAAAQNARLIHTLTGHKGGLFFQAVYGVAFGPIERLLASCSADKTVRLWDPATGEHRRTLTGHTGAVRGVAFGPAGMLASCSDDKTVRLWDPATGEHRRTLTGHTGAVHGMAFGPAGMLASCSDDQTVRLWDPATGEHRRTLTGHTGAVRGVAFSPDARLLASCSDDKTVRLWDPATGEHRRTLTGHTGAVRGVAFGPAGMLASCSDDKTVRLWDPATGEHRRTLTGHTGAVRGVAFSPAGMLASSSSDQTVRLWDPATGEHRRTLTGHTGAVRGVAFSPDARLLASCSDDKMVRLWDLSPVGR